MDLMQPRQICGRPTGFQMRALLDELEALPHLARGRTRGQDSRRRCDSLWRQISQRLNNLGGCTKSHKQWQKFWADKKSAVKKQVAARQAEGTSISAAVFSDIELRIINLIEKTKQNHDEDENGSTKSVSNSDNQEELDYIMSDSEDIQEENPLIEVPIESSFVYEVKKEPQYSRNAVGHSSQKPKVRLPRNSTRHKKSQGINHAKLMQRILRLEKRRTENEEKASNTLASIAACMKRQEEATQRLTRVLLQLVPRVNNMTQFQSRIQCSKPSAEQVGVLLDELEANPYLAQGKLRRRSTPLWKAITKRLNSIEGCTKSAKQWMKYWSDKKVAVKRMLEAARVSAENNGPDLVATFTATEHRVIAILENPAFVEAPDFAAPEFPSMEEEYLENDEYMSDVNEESFLEQLQNPLTSATVDSKLFEVKQEPHSMKHSLRSSAQKAQRQGDAKRSRSAGVSAGGGGGEALLKRVLRMEERRAAAQEVACTALADIETTMRRQEEATRELARVLLRLLR